MGFKVNSIGWLGLLEALAVFVNLHASVAI